MFDRNLLKLDGMRGILGALVLLALVQAGFIIAQTVSLASAIVSLWDGAPVEQAFMPALAFAACFCVVQVVKFCRDTMLDWYSAKEARALRGAVLEQALGRRLIAHSFGAAAVATAVTDGVDEVQSYLRIIPPKIIGIAALSVPVLVYTFTVDWVSGIILAVMFPVIMFFMILLGKQARARSERQYERYTLLSNRFMDTLRGMRVLKAFGAADSEAESVYEHSEDLRVATVRTLTTATLSSAVLDLCATFGVAAVAMMLAFRLMDGSVDLNTGLVALMLAPEYFSPIRAFASDYHASLDGKNALAALLDMLPAGAGAEAEEADAVPVSNPAAWNATSCLELHGVSFAYDETGAGLNDVSLAARGFERIGIVGASGSGKSTLSNILAGFCAPTSGSITVDGENMRLDSPAWTRFVRYVPQAPYIFRATLADNIRFYVPDASDADVAAAAEAVGLERLVHDLPDGLNTLVGEGARGLSGGEAHRVALARILLDHDARVLVFDEPTAHLDVETEQDLKAPMLAAMEGRLVFFATHRLHWVADMDRVVMLGGEMAEEACKPVA